jgi:hypothetical protein
MPLWVWCTPGTVGQIVTGFSRIVPLAALCGLPNAYPSPGGSLTRLRATLGRPLGSPSHAECRSLTGVSPSHRRAPGHHATARALAQQHVPGNANGCHLACIQGVPGGSSGAPALSMRARHELGLSPLSLSTITTLSGSHVIAGAAVAMRSLGSAVAIAMMVGGGGAPPLAALLGPDWIRTPGWAPS